MNREIVCSEAPAPKVRLPLIRITNSSPAPPPISSVALSASVTDGVASPSAFAFNVAAPPAQMMPKLSALPRSVPPQLSPVQARRIKRPETAPSVRCARMRLSPVTTGRGDYRENVFAGESIERLI